jgi:hypothetical protein
MRTGALALLLLMTGCGQPQGGDPAGNESPLLINADLPETAATVTIAASGPGNCSARWDGQPVNAAQLLQRSAGVVEQALNAAGGIANLTEETIPAINVEAPAALSFACADTVLGAIRRGGVPSVLLKPEGGREPALADFTLSEINAPPPTVAIAVGAGGRLSWNREVVSLDALTERMRQMGGGGASDIEAPPGEVELRPAREATFGQVHEALLRIRQGHVRAALLLPSVEPSPRAPLPVRPGPPPEADAPSNQAAPAR